MAGILIPGPRVIGARTHSIIDYVHAATNFAAGAMFRRRKNIRASNAAYALGAGVLVNALCTDYPLGVFRVYNFKVHGLLDYGVAAASAAMPELLRLKNKNSAEARFFRAQGAGETVIAGISDYGDNTGAKRTARRVSEWSQQRTRRRLRAIA